MSDAPYRGEVPRLRRRIDELEEELASTRAELRAARARPVARSARAARSDTRLGLLAVIRLETTLDGELNEAAHEEMQEALLARDGRGHVSTVGGTFRWALRDETLGEDIELVARSRDGRTVITLRDDRRSSVVGFSFIGLCFGVFGFLLMAVVKDGLSQASGVVLSVATFSLLGVFAMRVFLAWAIEGRRKAHVDLFAELERIGEKHGLTPVPGARVRAGGDARAADDARGATSGRLALDEAEREARAESEAARDEVARVAPRGVRVRARPLRAASDD